MKKKIIIFMIIKLLIINMIILYHIVKNIHVLIKIVPRIKIQLLSQQYFIDLIILI
jgi:hypothetical protein